MIRNALRLAVVAVLLAGSAMAEPDFAGPFLPLDAFAQTAAMARGLNVMSDDPGWADPAKAQFRPRYFAMIHGAGFSNVRIVMKSFDHIDASNRLDPAWLAFLDRTVSAALAAGLTVVLDEQDFMLCGTNLDACRPKLNAFWSEIAQHYKNASNRLLFEILNEPFGQLTPERWNIQFKETLALIRASNPSRNVVIGPTHWDGLEDLPKLELPDDPHIIVTFHYYSPLQFTHQGAFWMGPDIAALHDVPWGSDADRAALNADMDRVKAWGLVHHRAIFMGEFGAFEKAPLPDRYVWTEAVARAAEVHGFAWAHWEFKGGFAVYGDDEHWIEPALRTLIPAEDEAKQKL